MDNSFPQQGSSTQQRRGFSANLRIVNRFENWLAHIMQLTQLTEDEQRSAGIHLRQLSEDEQMGAGIGLDDRGNG